MNVPLYYYRMENEQKGYFAGYAEAAILLEKAKSLSPPEGMSVHDYQALCMGPKYEWFKDMLNRAEKIRGHVQARVDKINIQNQQH